MILRPDLRVRFVAAPEQDGPPHRQGHCREAVPGALRPPLPRPPLPRAQGLRRQLRRLLQRRRIRVHRVSPPPQILQVCSISEWLSQSRLELCFWYFRKGIETFESVNGF